MSVRRAVIVPLEDRQILCVCVANRRDHIVIVVVTCEDFHFRLKEAYSASVNNCS